MRARRRTGGSLLPAVALAATAALASGCGGGGGGSGDGGAGDDQGRSPDGDATTGTIDGSPRFITETDIEVPTSTRVSLIDDPQGSSRADLSDATYNIRIAVRAPNGETLNFGLGTGFAVGGNLIATNAHVSSGILSEARQLARSGLRVTRVSAYRAETGDEIPLLEALVHPSWNGSERSPDIGLLVSRAPLPVALELATDAEVGAVRSGDAIIVNGFPGNVDQATFGTGFDELSIPRATLFSSNVQSLQKFDERSEINPNDPLDIDLFQHGADTSPGTSGSPILKDGKVIAVHNAGLQNPTLIAVNGQAVVRTVPDATASWGVHVKHLKNLLAEYRTGTLEQDKRFRLPPGPELLQVAAGGQSTDVQGLGGDVSRFAGSLRATVSNAGDADVTHTIAVTVAPDGSISGTSSWPPNSGGGAREFALSGGIDENGLFEILDDAPERLGFRQGLYRGNVNGANGAVDGGEYYDVTESGQLRLLGTFGGTVR